jgi:hypothetical protein
VEKHLRVSIKIVSDYFKFRHISVTLEIMLYLSKIYNAADYQFN